MRKRTMRNFNKTKQQFQIIKNNNKLKNKRNKLKKTVLFFLLLFLIVSVSGCTLPFQHSEESTATTEEKGPHLDESTLTEEQKMIYRYAKDELDKVPYSREDLKQTITYYGDLDEKDIDFILNEMENIQEVNWKEEALKSAEMSMSMGTYKVSELKAELMIGALFTEEEADYAVAEMEKKYGGNNDK